MKGLIDKIKKRDAVIGVIGLGYVGLPIVIEFCKAGFRVLGFDIDEEKINMLREGKNYIRHIDINRTRECSSLFMPTSDFSNLREADCIIICVPTPLNGHREPDMSYVFNTAKVIAENLRQGQIVILESTTYPGTTDEDMRAILEETGLRAGQHFCLAYSPEREDPNNGSFSTRNTPKVVGGYSPKCLNVACELYSNIVERVVPVSSIRVAEATKLLENIYRAVNIALVNELKMLYDRMGIDIWEIIDAAKTKPFGFQPFYPGPGIGGHCIPLDPFYLTWKAREYDFHTRFIELAGEINTAMPYYVAQRTIESLNRNGTSIKGARILVLGLAYKKDVDDVRESPSLKIIELLTEKGAYVDYNDPYIQAPPSTRKFRIERPSVSLTKEVMREYDCTIIATDHTSYDAEFIVKHSNLVIDTRYLVKKENVSDKVVRA